MVYEVGGKEYPVVTGINMDNYGVLPLVDIPMMSDLGWLYMCLESRLEHPEYYSGSEDVDSAIDRLRRDIAEREARGETREPHRIGSSIDMLKH